MTLTQLYEEIETTGIEVDCFKMREVEAFSMPKIIVIDPTKLKDEKDEKLKIAHEYGHCLTNSFYNAKNPLDVKSKHEHKANKCAIKKLVTEDELHDAVCKGYVEIWELAEYFDIPEDFMYKIVCFYEGLEW